MKRTRQVEVCPQGIVILPQRMDVVAAPSAGDWTNDNGQIKIFNGSQWENEQVDELDEVEAKLLKIKQAKDVQLALDTCTRALIPEHGTRIHKIVAEGAAEDERSVTVTLPVEHTARVFEALKAELESWLAELKAGV